MTLIDLVIYFLNGHTESFMEALMMAELFLNCENIDPDFVAAVDKHFWELF